MLYTAHCLAPILFLCFSMAAHTGSAQAEKEKIMIRSMELRNYIVKPGKREEFAAFMNEYIVPKQESLGGYMLDEFRLKGADDNFVWMRGFTDMKARSKFLQDFYYSEYWKLHRPKTNSLLVDSYDVHLLKPLVLNKNDQDTTRGVELSAFRKNGITVAHYYYTNNQRNELIDLFARKYLPALESAGVTGTTLWICETVKNDYAPQHVFQDGTLLVMLSSFNDEVDYQAKTKKAEAGMDESTRHYLKTLVKEQTTQLLYPIR